MADLEQEWNKTRKTEPTEDVFTYKYYVIGESKPVRLIYDSEGLRRGAESINIHTGQLEMDHMIFMRILKSWEVEEIDQTRFEELCDELCQKLLQKKKNDRPGIGDPS